MIISDPPTLLVFFQTSVPSIARPGPGRELPQSVSFFGSVEICGCNNEDVSVESTGEWVVGQ